MDAKELLIRAREEIRSLRTTNEKQAIRLTAIDDFLGVLHGKPGTKTEGGMSPDIVYEIEKALSGPIEQLPLKTQKLDLPNLADALGDIPSRP